MSIGNGRIACEFILYISFCSNSYGLLQKKKIVDQFKWKKFLKYI